MPQVEVKNISIHYQLDGSEPGDLVVLVNGLGDDRETWAGQIPALLHAGFRVLSYDNRGIGQSSKPEGPYTSELLADDLHVLLIALAVQRAHLVGVSMGGMILQSYALQYPNTSPRAQGVEMLSLTLACTYAHPTEFCSRMFDLWADMAVKMSVQDVMRDVTLWAFTVPFFRARTEELRAVEAAMAELDMPLHAYLGQLEVIRRFDSAGALEGLRAEGQGLGGLEPGRILVVAGRVDILIPVVLSRELAERIEGAVFRTCKGGHACLWEFPEDFNSVMLGFLDEWQTKSSGESMFPLGDPHNTFQSNRHSTPMNSQP